MRTLVIVVFNLYQPAETAAIQIGRHAKYRNNVLNEQPVTQRRQQYSLAARLLSLTRYRRDDADVV